MPLSLKFARRYLSSKKSLSVINSTARVSSAAIGVAVAAMVILLSVYNGFDARLRSIYDLSDADLTLSPAKGKTFETTSLDTAAIKAVKGVAGISLFIEDNVMVEYRERQMFASLRGVDSLYNSVVDVEKQLWYGKWQLTLGDYRKAVVGRSLDEIFADGYAAKNTVLHSRLTLYAPRHQDISPLLPLAAVKSATLSHAGTLADSATSLTNTVFTSLDVAQNLLSAPGRISGAAIKVVAGENPDKVAAAVRKAVGGDFKVQTRFEHNSMIYRVIKNEKWIIFFILLLVTVIAAVSIIGSLVMLIIEKRDDTSTLYAMGARRRLIERIFTAEGMLIGGLGVVGGIVLGLAVCWVQWRFGIVKMPGTTFLMENYPVIVRATDIVEIAVAVMAVTWIITTFTVRKMVHASDSRK